MLETDNHKKIMNAAIDLVGEYGYKGTTTRLIAERSKVNEVTIFRKFGTKQKLFEKAVPYIQAQIAEVVQEKKIDHSGDLKEDVVSLCLSLMEVLAQKKETVAAVLFEVKREPFARDAGESMVSFIKNFIRSFLTDFPDLKELSGVDLDVLAVAILSFVFTRVVFRERVLSDVFRESNRRVEVENFVRFLVEGLDARSGSLRDSGVGIG